MATRVVSTKLEISGEKEYKQALSEVNSGLKVLDSEMKLVSAQFADNGDSVEALAAKQDVLTRQISTQKEKIETLRAALQSSAEAYGESDTRTMKWQTSLNNAEADLAKLNNQLGKNDQALQDALDAWADTADAVDDAADAMDGTTQSSGKTGTALGTLKTKLSDVLSGSKGLGDALGDLANKLGVNLPKGAQTALNGLGSINPAAIAAAGGVTALAAAIVKAESALKDLTEASASYSDEILTLSAQTGLSTTALQEFEYASELLDVSVDTLQGSLTKLTNNMQTAANTGTGDAYTAFEQLGVAITNTDGSLRSAQDVFFDTIDALGQVQNATERDALSMDIFGKSAQDLNPLILQGSEALIEYAQEAQNVGYVMSTDMLEALGAVDEAQQRLKKTQEAVTNQIAAEYAPYMEAALGNTATLIKNVGDTLTQSGIIESLGKILQAGTQLLTVVGQLAAPIMSLVSGPLKILADGIAVIADIAQEVIAFITGDYSYKATNASQKAVNAVFSQSGLSTASYTSSLSGLSTSGSTGLYSYIDANGVDYSTGTAGTTQYVPELGAYITYDKNGNASQSTWLSAGDTTGLEQAHIETLDDILNDERLKNAMNRSNGSFSIGGGFGSNASGTYNFPGGWTWVGENGPELANLPSGTQIYTNQESRQMGGGDTYYITIDAKSVKEFNDIVQIAQNQRRISRMEG